MSAQAASPIMGETISVRVTTEEKLQMDAYAKLVNKTLSATIKDLFFEKLAEEFDIKRIEAYRQEKANGTAKRYTLDEIENELGLANV